MPMNSLMSAPATKPLFLADVMISALGGDACRASSRAFSSSMTARDRLLAEASALSIDNQAMPDSSVVRVQLAVAGAGMAFSLVTGICGREEFHTEITEYTEFRKKGPFFLRALRDLRVKSGTPFAFVRPAINRPGGAPENRRSVAGDRKNAHRVCRSA